MIILKLLLLIIAFFVTLLWVSKFITDCVSAIYGKDFSDESAQKDGIIRLILCLIMSIVWPLIIIIW